jgi:hypothetical protein
MGSKLIVIAPGFEAVLDYIDDLKEQVIEAVLPLARAVALDIVTDGVYIKGIEISRRNSLLRIGFYREKGRYIRVYIMETAELLSLSNLCRSLAQPLDIDDVQTQQELQTFTKAAVKFRRW